MYPKKRNFFAPGGTDFIFEVTTTASPQDFTLPITGTVSFVVYWGDGNDDTITSLPDVNTTHSYTTAGTYQVRIRGLITNFEVDGIVPTKTQITDIIQWGSIGQTLMNFTGCTNLTSLTATDAPDTTNMTTLRSLFEGCTNLSNIPNITDWNLTPINNTSRMFYLCSNFNQSLAGWDVSSVTDMNTMFRSCTNFNGSLAGWDTSSCTNMGFMFNAASAFNQSISHFDVGNVTSFQDFLRGATVFNQPLNTWVFTTDIGKNVDCGQMFMGAKAFNQPLSNWNTGRITLMDGMFNDADAFNQNLNTSGASWDVSKVTNFTLMFANTTNFNGTLTGWTTTAATGGAFVQTFKDAKAFNQPVDHLDLNGVTSIETMFWGASVFNQTTASWDLSTLTGNGMQSVFLNATAYTGIGTPSWTIPTGVTSFNRIFESTSYNQNIDGWNVSNISNFSKMFYSSNMNQSLNSWTIKTTGTVNMSSMFQATPMNGNITSWNTSAVTTMNAMFMTAGSFNQNISGWNVSAVTDFTNMFQDADSFNQPIGSWTTSAATLMGGMFRNNNIFNSSVANFDVSGLTSAVLMFNNTAAWGTTNYDLLLDIVSGWGSQTVNSGVSFEGGASYTQTSVDSGTTDGTTANKLVDSTQNFLTTVTINDIVHNTTDNTYAKVTAIDSDTQLSLDNDIMISGETYVIQSSNAAKGRYSLLSQGWTIIDGGPV